MFEVFTSLLLRLTHTHTHKKKTTAVGIFLLFFFLFFLFYFVGRCNFVPDRWGNGSAEGDELGGRGPGLFFSLSLLFIVFDLLETLEIMKRRISYNILFFFRPIHRHCVA